MKNENANLRLLARMEHKNPKKNFEIFEDRVVFNGNTILYDDIQTIEVMARTVNHSLIANQFMSTITFKTKDGTKKMHSLNGVSVFGLGTQKSQEEKALDLINKLYHLTAADVAKRHLAEIHKGNCLNYNKIEIDADKAIFNKAFNKQTVIDKSNFRNYVLVNDKDVFPVFIDAKGKEIAAQTTANMILMPYLLDELYG